MRDHITAKITIEADYETIQSIRLALADESRQADLSGLIAQATQAYLASLIEPDFELDTTLKVSRYSETSHRTSPTPTIEDNVLSWVDPEAGRTNIIGPVGSEDYFKALGDGSITSFSYRSAAGNFTAICRKNGLWYAHKKVGGKLRRKYLGKADKLTGQKLEKIAEALSGVTG